jgi:hypothetical protein
LEKEIPAIGYHRKMIGSSMDPGTASDLIFNGLLTFSVADPDPGSGVFFYPKDPGSGIIFFRIPDIA